MVLRRLLAAGLLAVWAGWAWAAPAYELKFATLAPEGTSWMRVLNEWAAELEDKSAGRLRVKIYPGGVAGDEPDVLRKIRFGQLQGCAITGYGVGYIFPPARILEMPFLFESYAEVDAVRPHLMPDIRAGFRDNGYELVGWMEVGFVRMFSNQPVRSLDDLKRQRIWIWQGDPLAETFFSVAGVRPIPLSITDVFTSLSTGLIDTVYAPPMGAIALQWFTKTRYVTERTVANGIGALVVARRFYEGLPEDLQALVSETGAEAGRRLIETTRADNEKSLIVLHEHGLEFVGDWKQEDEARIPEVLAEAQAKLAEQDYIPASWSQRVQALLDELRAPAAGRDHARAPAQETAAQP